MKTSFKVIIVSIIALLSCTQLKAQNDKVTFGVKAGMNVSNFSGDISGTDAKIGFNAGVTLDYAFTNNLYLLTGLEFTSKGAKASILDYSGYYDADWGYGDDVSQLLGEAKVTMNVMYLQVPIHIGYKLEVAENVKLVFNAGPYIAYGVAGNTSVKIQNVTVKEKSFQKDGFNRFDMGLGLGTGAEFGKIGVKLGYDFGLLNVADSSGDGTVRNGNFTVGVGYKF